MPLQTVRCRAQIAQTTPSFALRCTTAAENCENSRLEVQLVQVECGLNKYVKLYSYSRPVYDCCILES